MANPKSRKNGTKQVVTKKSSEISNEFESLHFTLSYNVETMLNNDIPALVPPFDSPFINPSIPCTFTWKMIMPWQISNKHAFKNTRHSMQIFPQKVNLRRTPFSG